MGTNCCKNESDIGLGKQEVTKTIEDTFYDQGIPKELENFVSNENRIAFNATSKQPIYLHEDLEINEGTSFELLFQGPNFMYQGLINKFTNLPEGYGKLAKKGARKNNRTHFWDYYEGFFKKGLLNGSGRCCVSGRYSEGIFGDGVLETRKTS